MKILYRNTHIIPSDNYTYKVSLYSDLEIDKDGLLTCIHPDYANGDMMQMYLEKNELNGTKFFEIARIVDNSDNFFYYGHLISENMGRNTPYRIASPGIYGGTFNLPFVRYKNYGANIRALQKTFPEQLRKETGFLDRLSKNDDFIHNVSLGDTPEEAYLAYCDIFPTTN